MRCFHSSSVIVFFLITSRARRSCRGVVPSVCVACLSQAGLSNSLLQMCETALGSSLGGSGCCLGCASLSPFVSLGQSVCDYAGDLAHRCFGAAATAPAEDAL